MVTFTPRLSHARFGQQQASTKATTEASVTPQPGHDHVTLSTQSKTSQVQFGAISRRKVLAGGGGLTLLGLLTACMGGGGTKSNETNGQGAGGTQGADKTSGAGDTKPVGTPADVLSGYETSYRFPKSIDIEGYRKADASEVGNAEGGLRNDLLADMPKHMMWLLGYENPKDPQTARANPAMIDALPYRFELVGADKKPIDRKTIAAAGYTEQMYKTYATAEYREYFRVIAENVRERLEKPLIDDPMRTKIEIGALLPEDKKLGSKTEGYEAAYALFMLKMILAPAEYDKLVSNNKLVKAKDTFGGGTCIQFYDFSDKDATALKRQQGKATDKAQENVNKIFQSSDNKDLAVLVADYSKLNRSDLDDGTIKTIGKSGVYGSDNLVVFVDTAKLAHDPAKAAIALWEGLKKANGQD